MRRLPVFVSPAALGEVAAALLAATGALALPFGAVVALVLAEAAGVVLVAVLFLLLLQAASARATMATPAAICVPLRLTSMSLLLAAALWVVRE
ncbi:MAG TPA: hypothetical protein VGD55_03145 [Acidothermaceae bacterium]